jgi:hypothetical protein
MTHRRWHRRRHADHVGGGVADENEKTPAGAARDRGFQ